MNFRCATPACAIASSGASFPAAMPCPLCHQPLIDDAADAPPAAVQPVLAEAAVTASGLPTLLALPLTEMLHEPSPTLALWAACDLVELALRLIVMAGVAEHGPRLPDDLRVALRDRIELPTLGKWLGMAQAIARNLPPDTALPELRSTVRSLEELLGRSDAPPDAALLPLRNRLAHGGPVSRTESERLRGVWVPRIRAWAASSLRWLEATAVVAVDGSGHRFLLRGERGTAAGNAPALPSDAPAGSVWLVAGTRALPLEPLGAFDSELRAVQVYVRRGEVRLQYLRMGDDGGLCDSDPATLQSFRERFLAQEVVSAAQHHVIRSFDDEVRRESARRVGREHELAMLRTASSEMIGGALWVAGPAGIGKSNLLAALMEQLLDAPPADTLVLPYRFRAGDDRCGRTPFLTYLRERLDGSEWLAPEKGDEVAGQEAGAEEGSARKKKRSRSDAAADPVQEVKSLLARLRPGARVLMVLDGLDEIAERDARFADDVVLRLPTASVAIVAAGRPERGLPEAFARAEAEFPFPNGLPPMGEDDVRALLLERTGPVRKRLLARDRERGEEVTNTFIARVTQQSAGLPIYVNYVAGDLNAGKLSPESTDALPASLHAYHDELLRRASIGDLQAVTTPMLVLLALSHEPLTVEELATLLRRRGVLDTIDGTLVERAVQIVGAMVRRAPDPDGEEGFTVFHHSLRMHVLGSPELRETVAVTRAALAEAAMQPAGDAAEVYLYRCGVRHLLEAERRNDAVAVMTDFDRVMARLRRLDATGRAADEWYADWERVRFEATPEGDARVWWDFARTNRHYFRKEGWESWRVLFQAAMDHADDSPVARGAERMLASGTVDWTWLRWVNRPKEWQESALVSVCVGQTEVYGMLQLQDGRLLAWGDSTIRVWDPKTGDAAAVFRLHSQSVICGVVQRPDGNIVSWGYDGVRVWDAQSGAVSARVDVRMHSARMLSDGRMVLWSEEWKRCRLMLWNLDANSSVVILDVENRSIDDVRELRAGTLLTWGSEGVPHLRDAHDGRSLAALAEHPQEVSGLLEAGNGQLVSWPHKGDGGPELRVWDASSGAYVGTLAGHTDAIQGVDALDAGRIVSWSRDKTRRVWSLDEFRCIEISKCKAGPPPTRWRGVSFASAFSAKPPWEVDVERIPDQLIPRGRAQRDYARPLLLSNGLVVGSDTAVSVWDPTTWRRIAAIPLTRARRGGVAIHLSCGLPRERRNSYVAVAVDGGSIEVWDLDRLKEENADAREGIPVDAVLALPDARVLTWCRAAAAVWDTDRGTLVTMFSGHEHFIMGAVALSSGSVASWAARVILVWSPQTGQIVATLRGHADVVNGAIELPGGRLLSWSKDRTLRVWSLETGEVLVVYAQHRYHDIEVLPLDDDLIASWDRDNGHHPLRVWSAHTGEDIATFEGHSEEIRGVAADSPRVLISWSMDKTIRRWTLDSPQTPGILIGHTNRILGCHRFDEQHLVSWAEDKTIRVWNVESGREVRRMNAPGPTLRSVARLRGHRLLARCAPGFPRMDDITMHVWNLQTGELLGPVEPDLPSQWLAVERLVNDHDALVPERFAVHRLVEPHEYVEPAFGPYGLVAYPVGSQLRICRMVSPRRDGGSEGVSPPSSSSSSLPR